MRRIVGYCILLTMILIIPALTGCQSTNKRESYFDSSGIGYTRFEYDATSAKTLVVWMATLTNETIYNFNEFSVTFSLFNDSTLLRTETYYYEQGVKHGEEYTGVFNFRDDGQITSIEYISWTAHYASFWSTYKVWLIVMMVLAAVGSLIYIIVMIIEDLELDDVGDFLEENWWIFFSLILPVGGTIWGMATSNWVPVLIVLGGIVAFILIALLGHLIKYIVEWGLPIGGWGVSFGGDKRFTRQENENYFDIDVEEVSDYVNDREKLELFRVEQLKDYCRESGIRGFSSLNKAGIVDLIIESDAEQTSSDNGTTDKTKSGATSGKVQHKITFDDIAGLEEAKRAFKEKIVFAFAHKDLYEKYGKKVGGGILLYGLPGTGKTMFAEAASNETNALFIPIKCSDIKSKWYGESEANVKKIFDKARKAKKAILFFDEFEAIGAKRTDDGENGNNDLVPQILAEMQGVGSAQSNCIIVVIAATNKPWAIDSAFLRPGRFDEKIYIPLPDYEARKKLFELKLQAVPHENLDYAYLSGITDGFNGADIGAFCDKLKMLAINKSIETGNECPITMDDVAEVKESVKSSVSGDDVERLLEFRDTYR